MSVVFALKEYEIRGLRAFTIVFGPVASVAEANLTICIGTGVRLQHTGDRIRHRDRHVHNHFCLKSRVPGKFRIATLMSDLSRVLTVIATTTHMFGNLTVSLSFVFASMTVLTSKTMSHIVRKVGLQDVRKLKCSTVTMSKEVSKEATYF